ncbi:MAG: YkvA family protein [Burkholderiaceae bacterium]
MWKRLSTLSVAIRGDVLRLWYALGHPDAPAWLKAATAAMLLYVVSPFDLIPDVLPVIGVLDDVVLVTLALRWLLARLPAHIRQYADERSRGGSGTRRASRPADPPANRGSRLRR